MSARMMAQGRKPAAGSSTTFFTDFSEYTTGVAPSDWTNEWHAATWTVESDAGATGGKVLNLADPASSRVSLSWDDVGDVDDVEIVARVRMYNGTGSNWGGRIRGSGNDTSESAYSVNFNGTVHRLHKYVSATSTNLGTDTNEASLSAPNWIWVRLQAIGTTVKYRLWADGDAEPGTWDESVTDSSLASGWVGVGGFNGRTEWDLFGVSTDPATTPAPKTAAGSGSGFDPIAGVGWAHAYWADHIAVGDGNTVQTWADEVGADDFTQATAGARPTFRAADATYMNGQPSLEFDGTSDYMNCTYGTALTVPHSLVLVARIRSDSGGNNFITDSPQLFWSTGGPWRWNNGSSQNADASANADLHLHTAIFNTTSDWELDGTLIDPSATIGTGSQDGFALAATTGGVAPSSLTIAFVGVFDGDVRTDPGWVDFQTWVEVTYGLTIA